MKIKTGFVSNSSSTSFVLVLTREARDKILDVMLKYGLSGTDAIKQIQREILNLSTNNKNKMILTEKCGEAEFRMNEGSDEFIQLEAFLAQVCLVGK